MKTSLFVLLIASFIGSASAAEYKCSLKEYQGYGDTEEEISPSGKYILTKLNVKIQADGHYYPWSSYIAIRNLDGSLVEGKLTACDLNGQSEYCRYSSNDVKQSVNEDSIKFKRTTGNDDYIVKLGMNGEVIESISVSHYLYDSLTNYLIKNKNNKIRCVKESL